MARFGDDFWVFGGNKDSKIGVKVLVKDQILSFDLSDRLSKFEMQFFDFGEHIWLSSDLDEGVILAISNRHV